MVTKIFIYFIYYSLFKFLLIGYKSNEVIIINREFIKLEINIPCNEIKDFIYEIKDSIWESDLKFKNQSPNNIKPARFISNTNMELQLFNVKEVGKRLKINPSAVYQLIKSGHLRALKLGSLKVTSTELERFLKYAEGKDFTDLNNIKELQSDK